MNRKEKAKCIVKFWMDCSQTRNPTRPQRPLHPPHRGPTLSPMHRFRVNKVTPNLFKKASTPQQMVQLKVSEIEKLIKTCGLSKTKAKAIHALSEILLDQFDGAVPQTFEELESLPGVGHKTASVVMSQAFGKPAFPVDTHIHRLAKRWGLSSGKSVVQTEKDLKALFPKSSWNRLHLQIIYFARKYCPALRHEVEQCPICSLIKV